MMRKLSLTFSLIWVTYAAICQVETWSDNFDSYNNGDYLGVVGTSNGWTTWSGTTGGAEDVMVTNVDALSGSNSVFFDGISGGGPQDVVLNFGTKYDYGQFHFEMAIKSDTGWYFNLQAEQTIGVTWAIDVEGYQDSVYVFNYISGYVYHGIAENTSIGAWAVLEIDVELDSNIWVVTWDGNEIASFTNPNANSIASADIYPLDYDYDFFVDDVMWTWDTTVVIPEEPDTVEATVDGKTVYIVDGDTFELFAGEYVPLSIKRIALDEIKTYPIPASNRLFLDFGSNDVAFDLTIVNLQGQAVQRHQVRLNRKIHTLDLSNLPPGHYILNGNSEQGSFTKPVVISR